MSDNNNTNALSGSEVEADNVSENPTKGLYWSEEEHAAFLRGLKECGKGSWREIAKYYVPTRTPTQVASHAQKYAARLATRSKRKSRFSAVEEAMGISKHHRRTARRSERAEDAPRQSPKALRAASVGAALPLAPAPASSDLLRPLPLFMQPAPGFFMWPQAAAAMGYGFPMPFAGGINLNFAMAPNQIAAANWMQAAAGASAPVSAAAQTDPSQNAPLAASQPAQFLPIS